MPDHIVSVTYFDKTGPECTTKTLEAAYRRAQELGIKHVVVATNTGATGAATAQLMRGCHVTAVTHSTGFTAPNAQELEPEQAEIIRQHGGSLLTTTHAFGGIGRAVRRKLSAYQVDEIIAFVLRTFGQGTKVACEITIMAADAGLIPAGEAIIAIGGSGRGVDTALVIRSANAQDYFDLRVLEIICKPGSWH